MFWSSTARKMGEWCFEGCLEGGGTFLMTCFEDGEVPLCVIHKVFGDFGELCDMSRCWERRYGGRLSGRLAAI